jgi:alpha-amylase/alpha-mannosidase (GH57 family)
MRVGTLNAKEKKLCEDQLSVCEGSDWFWWLGDYNPASSASSFDRLYRRNLSNLYTLLRQPVPVRLLTPISVSESSQIINDTVSSGTMKRGQEL